MSKMREVLGVCLLILPVVGLLYYVGGWLFVGEILALLGAGVLVLGYIAGCVYLIDDGEGES